VKQSFDVIILGLGGMGSAVAAHLAGRGKRVLGLDQFTPPHDKGSSHGKSRVIRQAYYEDPSYVPLLLRAYELWRELGPDLLTVTGGLMIGRPDSEVVAGSLRSARQHGLPHELLDAGQIRRRFTQFTPNDETVALFEKNAGFVRPELAVRAHLDRAARFGATLRFDEKVTGLDGTSVTTTRSRYEAGQLVITAGPWVTDFVKLPVTVERQVQFWFEPTEDIERLPIWIWETEDRRHPYGLPPMDGAVKVAFHEHGSNRVCTPDTIDRTVREEEVATMRACLRDRIPRLPGRLVEAKTCLYTSTPNGHFIIDRYPARENVWIVSPCSGHGFKFCPVIGEIVADLVTRGRTDYDLSLFRLAK
jgi:sarcosine oxidase